PRDRRTEARSAASEVDLDRQVDVRRLSGRRRLVDGLAVAAVHDGEPVSARVAAREAELIGLHLPAVGRDLDDPGLAVGPPDARPRAPDAELLALDLALRLVDLRPGGLLVD